MSQEHRIRAAGAFASAKETIAYADEHIAEAGRRAKEFFEARPYQILWEPDADSPGHLISYLEFTEPLPFRIQGLLSDATINLRSALDHLGFAVATATNQPGQNCDFPFGQNALDVSRRRGKGYCKEIPPEIFDVMAAFQPYRGGNDILWKLNKLANTNKHKVRVLPFVAAQELTFQGAGYYLNVGSRVGEHNKIPLTRERLESPNTFERLTIKPTICFATVDSVQFNKPAIRLLKTMSVLVRRIAEAVESESKNLGIL